MSRRVESIQELFGGRPLTQAESEAVLRIEKKRSRWRCIMMLPVVVLLTAGMVILVNHACERTLQRACLRELGFDPQYGEANYNAYCMVEYHNQVNGTDIDYFSREERRQVSPELEAQMRRAYFLEYLYASEEEQILFEPELTFEQFDQRIQRIADETRARLAPAYAAKLRLCCLAAACLILISLALIAFPVGSRHLRARDLLCRSGVMSLPFASVLSWKRMLYLQTTDAKGTEFDHCLKIRWWEMIPSETKLAMKTEELPVLLVMADGKLTYYPMELLETAEA